MTNEEIQAIRMRAAGLALKFSEVIGDGRDIREVIGACAIVCAAHALSANEPERGAFPIEDVQADIATMAQLFVTELAVTTKTAIRSQS